MLWVVLAIGFAIGVAVVAMGLTCCWLVVCELVRLIFQGEEQCTSCCAC